MLCGPAASKLVESVATPAESGTVPRFVTPSRNETLPVGTTGIPPWIAVTVAVNVTNWPTAEGFTELTRVVVVGVKAEPSVFRDGTAAMIEARVATPATPRHATHRLRVGAMVTSSGGAFHHTRDRPRNRPASA